MKQRVFVISYSARLIVFDRSPVPYIATLHMTISELFDVNITAYNRNT